VSRYLPIADHGLIGDLHSVALVGTDGTIDWYCCPRFDSPSVFGSILDARAGGCYRLAPADDNWTSKQLYLPDTNILITRFLTPDGVGEVQDFMPVAQTIAGEHRQQLVRRVLAVRGQVGFELDCSPRFDYGRAEHTVERRQHGVLFRSADCALALGTETPLRTVDDRAARASFSLSQGKAPPLSWNTWSASTSLTTIQQRGRASWPRKPLPTGDAGCPSHATRGAGGRWCTARR
jgi:GH15 family glucan-1,4-alpha-glucosidase